MNKSCIRLIEAGGKISQDLGMGRMLGQVLLFLYLSPKEASLDEIGMELGLSKASVSIAARQLETFGLLRRVWKKGDRKSYYKTTDNIALALRQGLVSFFRQKIVSFGAELDCTLTALDDELSTEKKLENKDDEVTFLIQRVGRAKQLQVRLESIVENPVIRFLSKE